MVATELPSNIFISSGLRAPHTMTAPLAYVDDGGSFIALAGELHQTVTNTKAVIKFDSFFQCAAFLAAASALLDSAMQLVILE
jgi:hypothetical protein